MHVLSSLFSRFRPARFEWPAISALALLAGLLLAASHALHPVWWAAWLVPVPLVLLARQRPWPARLAVAAGAVVSMLPLSSYYLEMCGPWVTLSIVLLRVAALMLVLSLTRFGWRRLPLPLAMFVLPVSFAALELLTLRISVHGAAGSLAYSQMAHPELIQAAALGGVPAVVFAVLLPGSLVGLWLSHPWPQPQRTGAVAVLALLALGLGLFSAQRLRHSGPTQTVTMIASNRFDGIPGDWATVWAEYAPAIRQAAARGGLVVLPEKIALLDDEGAVLAERDIAEAARATGATVVVGLELKSGAVYRNHALLATPEGAIYGYDKQRLVPGFEDRDRPGTAPLVVPVAAALGVAICKDMHIPTIGLEYAGHAALLAVPAWDFGRDAWMGARMTALRGVEGGYSIARASRDGLLGAYDASGRVVAERVTDAGLTSLRAELPAVPRPTLYARMGDAFGWSCVLLLAALYGARLLPRRRWMPAAAASGEVEQG